LVVLVGALIQGAVGYGMNLIAAPLLGLIDPAMVPGPLLFIGSVHALLTVVREHGHVDWPGVGWAMIGRVPGTALGVLAVATLPHQAFSVVVGMSVLLCVVLSTISWRPQPQPGPLMTAGLASGAFGTAVSIGGPPIALLYQHSAGPLIRSTLAAYFAIGSVMSLGALALSGQISVGQVGAGGVLLPFLAAGFALSGPVRRVLDGGRIRLAVLTVAAVSAVLLIGRGLGF
jgi:uncharacterized membrane protein YfcA